MIDLASGALIGGIGTAIGTLLGTYQQRSSRAEKAEQAQLTSWSKIVDRAVAQAQSSDDRAAELAKALAEYSQRISALEAQVAELQKRERTAEERIEELEGRIDELEAEAVALTLDRDRYRDGYERLTAEMAREKGDKP